MDCGGEDRRAAIREVVAGDAGDHRVGEPERGHRLTDAGWLSFVDGTGLLGVDQAEPAGAGAPIAQDHERRGVLGPAFGDIRAPCTLADGVQGEGSRQPLRLAVARSEVGADPHPFGATWPRVLDGDGDAGLGEAKQIAPAAK